MTSPIIFHFHLFKNAGTSVDALLQQSFSGRWEEREFQGNVAEIKLQTAKWVQTNPDLIAFSSHTAIWSQPSGYEPRIFPIIFVRHPLDRIESVYEYERIQEIQNFPATLAKTHDFVGYVTQRNLFDGQCRNFHVSRLTQFQAEPSGSELEDALIAMNHFPVVGVVDRFQISMDVYRHHAANLGLSIATNNVHLNATREASLSLTERLAKLKERVGTTFFEQLEQSNMDDIRFYDAAVLRLERQLSNL